MDIASSAAGAALALGGAVLLAFGASLQHRGVADVRARVRDTARGSLQPVAALDLVRTRVWLAGILVTGLGMALNLVALRIAPLIVVQPLGVFAVIVAAVLDARSESRRIRPLAALGIALAVLGVGTFVTSATLTARNRAVSDVDLAEILSTLGFAVVPLAAAVLLFARRFPAVTSVLTAGILAGFVVTLAKAVIIRVTLGNFGWATWLGTFALLLVGVAAVYFTQRAYASGPVHVIVAGLTIVDPVVAVGLGVLSLGEAARTPAWAVAMYIVSGAIAVLGVVLLARSGRVDAAPAGVAPSSVRRAVGGSATSPAEP